MSDDALISDGGGQAADGAAATQEALTSADASSLVGSAATGDATAGELQEGPVKSLLDGADGDKGGEEPKAPEQYEDFVLPEGFEASGPLLDEFVPLAQAAGMTQEVAQQFVDMGAKLVQQAQAGAAAAWEKQVSDWTAAVKSDEQIGGVALKENTGLVVRALRQFGDQETRAYLEQSRLINHPGIFKMLAGVGKMLAEDKLFDGGGEARAKSTAEILFPNMN